MAKTTVRTFYRPHPRVQFTGELVNPYTGEVSVPPSMTKQEFVGECDINNIIKQYSVTGMVSHISSKAQQGAYQDLPDEVDFQTSLNIIKEGETAFMSLPAKVRSRFGNDPVQFLAFMADPDNQEEAIKLGLATRKPTVPPLGTLPDTPENAPPEGKDK